ncbi:MAG: helix-turn-helix domain-containing protein [Thermodesulfovibrionales bacterium]|nr:helix-turn-helix domain-containing protein [Thermodesulfovibrionales bacterium]
MIKSREKIERRKKEIKKALIEKDLTQKDIAKKAGVSHHMVNKYINYGWQSEKVDKVIKEILEKR